MVLFISELLYAEIGHRTKDTPAALQYENVAPLEYFSRLVHTFENQMILYRRQIEETEQHLLTMANHGLHLSVDDLARAIDKLQGTFVHLAARAEQFHEMVLKQVRSFHLPFVTIGAFITETIHVFEKNSMLGTKSINPQSPS